jgi:RHS repeat-associated protein
VGGLLGIWTGLDTASPKAYCAVNDGLGNVVGLLDAQNGKLVAEYEYSPFGELIRAAGPMAAQNPLRFASKYFNAETGLVNFGYRYYSASLGRFINRDPQSEPGWNNLLADLGAGGGPSWNYIGKLLRAVHENRYAGKEPSLAHSTESGGGAKNSSLNSASVMDRKGNASTVTASGPTAGAGGSGMAAAWSHPYGYFNNDPLNDIEYLGLWDLGSWWGDTFGGYGGGFLGYGGYGGLLGYGGTLDSLQSWTYDAMDSLFSLPGLDTARYGFQTVAGYDLFTQQRADRTLAYENFLWSAAGTSLMFAGGSAGAYGRAASASFFAPSLDTALSSLSSGARTSLKSTFEWVGL